MKKETSLSVNIESYLYALQQKNLVYNYNFKYFSNYNTLPNALASGHPDGWVYSNSGANGSVEPSGEACKIKVNSDGNAMSLTQALHEFPRWQDQIAGNTVTIEMQLTLTKGCVIQASLSDGKTSVIEEIIASENEEATIHLQLKVDDNPSQLILGITSSTASATITLSKVFGNVGDIALENLPSIVSGIIGARKSYISTQNAPSGELSICNNLDVDLEKDYTRLNSVLNGRFGKDGGGKPQLPNVSGYFSRAWDNGKKLDPNAADRKMLGQESIVGDFVGTIEPDSFKHHLHGLKFAPADIVSAAQGTPAKGINISGTSETKEQGEEETRPVNVFELFTIIWG